MRGLLPVEVSKQLEKDRLDYVRRDGAYCLKLLGCHGGQRRLPSLPDEDPHLPEARVVHLGDSASEHVQGLPSCLATESGVHGGPVSPITRVAGEARLFRLGLYLTVHAASEQESAERVTEVRNLAASLLLDTATVTWRQLQGWITCLPLGFDAVGMRRVFDTDALAAAFPFTSPDLPLGAGDAGMGVLFGLNLASSGVVVWDRWAQDNYNAAILARSGAGKSYLAKLALLRNLYLGVAAGLRRSRRVSAHRLDPPRCRAHGRGRALHP